MRLTGATNRYGQVPVAHEAGHAFGLSNEYMNYDNNPLYIDDPDSIMSGGMSVRPRHYQTFADWMNSKFEGCSYSVEE